MQSSLQDRHSFRVGRHQRHSGLFWPKISKNYEAFLSNYFISYILSFSTRISALFEYPMLYCIFSMKRCLIICPKMKQIFWLKMTNIIHKESYDKTSEFLDIFCQNLPLLWGRDSFGKLGHAQKSVNISLFSYLVVTLLACTLHGGGIFLILSLIFIFMHI